MGRSCISIRDRLLRHTVVLENGCWEWVGSKKKGNTYSYGIIVVGGKNIRVHRAAYEVFVGPIPIGMFVCHKCDFPLCINPEHLFLGTHQDNMNDAFSKGRLAKKLNMEDAQKIRKMSLSGWKGVELAKKFGVTPKMISYILNNERWKKSSSLT